MRNIKISDKLTIGFGLMIFLTLLVVAISHYSSEDAMGTIERTGDVRVPATLAASNAQGNLYRMTSSVRSYLALGDPEFRERYQESVQTFRADLERLDSLSASFDAENKRRLDTLKQTFEAWKDVPEQLFPLRDDQMKREPAYAWLNNEGAERVSAIRTNTTKMMQAQVAREPSQENTAMLLAMADFQNSFTAMFSGLRGYVTTRNQNYRSYEYEANLTINTNAWEKIVKQKDLLTPEQQGLVDIIQQNRTQFLDQIPTQIFAVMESDQWRLDLYLFRTDVVPKSEAMQQLLQEINTNQETALLQDLRKGQAALNDARSQTIFGGFTIAIIGVLTAFLLRRAILKPIRRLTEVATQVSEGDLTAVASVESRDEIGTFARTFNSMTTRVRETMDEIRNEKQRAAELQEEIIYRQKALLHELSTPLFPLADSVIAMPLIGSIDSTRAEQMMMTLLRGVAEYKARVAILDITGVPVVDTQVANALIRTSQAVRLLGTQVILTGIRAEVAQALVGIGTDLRNIVTHGTFQDGIAYALRASSNQHDLNTTSY